MRLTTGAKKKFKKAIVRVDKVVMMEFRKDLEQQRKWKAEVVKKTTKSAANKAAAAAAAAK